MEHLHTPAKIISLLQDIERRSQQRAAGLTQQDDFAGAWTAIGFRIDQQHLLIRLGGSREIFPVPQQITEVPKSQPWVFGIANLRGELLPIFDLKQFLQNSPTKVNKHSRVMVINHPEIYSGVLVDEVFGLKHFQREAGPHSPTQNLHLLPYLQGSIFQQDIQWDVFSLQKLVEDPRFLNAAA